MGFFRFKPSPRGYASPPRPPEYIFQGDTGLFIFRMKVPLDCQSVLNKRELKYSLRTRCLSSSRFTQKPSKYEVSEQAFRKLLAPFKMKGPF